MVGVASIKTDSARHSHWRAEVSRPLVRCGMTSSFCDCRPDQVEGRVRLTAILRTKTIKDDVSLALPDVDHRGAVIQLCAAQQPTGEERVTRTLVSKYS